MFSRFDFSLDDDLVNEFEEKDLADYLERLYRKAEKFLCNTKAPSTVYVNSTIYAHCCRNIVADLAKFKNLSVLTSEDNVKLNAYTAAWWIHRKPFQFKEICPQEILDINETFAATLLFQASNLYDKNLGRYTVDTDKLVEIAAPLMNYLKYQSITPQNLELFLKGLNF